MPQSSIEPQLCINCSWLVSVRFWSSPDPVSGANSGCIVLPFESGHRFERQTHVAVPRHLASKKTANWMDSKIWKVQSWLYYAWLFYDVLCKLGCRYQTWQQICRCNEKIQFLHWLILRFFDFLHVHMYCLCMLSGYSLEDWLWPHLWFLLYNQVISRSCSHMFPVDAVLFTKEIPHGRDLSGWELEVLLISISHRPQICNETQPSDDFPSTCRFGLQSQNSRHLSDLRPGFHGLPHPIPRCFTWRHQAGDMESCFRRFYAIKACVVFARPSATVEQVGHGGLKVCRNINHNDVLTCSKMF